MQILNNGIKHSPERASASVTDSSDSRVFARLRAPRAICIIMSARRGGVMADKFSARDACARSENRFINRTYRPVFAD